MPEDNSGQKESLIQDERENNSDSEYSEIIHNIKRNDPNFGQAKSKACNIF